MSETRDNDGRTAFFLALTLAIIWTVTLIADVHTFVDLADRVAELEQLVASCGCAKEPVP